MLAGLGDYCRRWLVDFLLYLVWSALLHRNITYNVAVEFAIFIVSWLTFLHLCKYHVHNNVQRMYKHSPPPEKPVGPYVYIPLHRKQLRYENLHGPTGDAPAASPRGSSSGKKHPCQLCREFHWCRPSTAINLPCTMVTTGCHIAWLVTAFPAIRLLTTPCPRKN